MRGISAGGEGTRAAAGGEGVGAGARAAIGVCPGVARSRPLASRRVPPFWGRTGGSTAVPRWSARRPTGPGRRRSPGAAPSAVAACGRRGAAGSGSLRRAAPPPAAPAAPPGAEEHRPALAGCPRRRARPSARPSEDPSVGPSSCSFIDFLRFLPFIGGEELPAPAVEVDPHRRELSTRQRPQFPRPTRLRAEKERSTSRYLCGMRSRIR